MHTDFLSYHTQRTVYHDGPFLYRSLWSDSSLLVLLLLLVSRGSEGLIVLNHGDIAAKAVGKKKRENPAFVCFQRRGVDPTGDRV